MISPSIGRGLEKLIDEIPIGTMDFNTIKPRVFGTFRGMLVVFDNGGNFISLNVRKKVNSVVPAFMIALAFLFILRGMNLGIPYISPQINQTEIHDEAVICH